METFMCRYGLIFIYFNVFIEIRVAQCKTIDSKMFTALKSISLFCGISMAVYKNSSFFSYFRFPIAPFDSLDTLQTIYWLPNMRYMAHVLDSIVPECTEGRKTWNMTIPKNATKILFLWFLFFIPFSYFNCTLNADCRCVYQTPSYLLGWQ